MAKIQRLCFTLNNYTDDEYAKIKEFITSKAIYGVVGEERGEENNTPHLQGYINLGRKARLSFAGAKKAIGERAHIEIARGSDEDNKAYCSKEGNVFEHGEIQFPGKRNDIEQCCKSIMGGKRLADVALEHPSTFVKIHRGLRELEYIVRSKQQRNFKTTVHVLIGTPGTGKSRWCHEQAGKAGADEMYYKPRGQWWDGYCGQKNVVIDDFYGWIKYDDLLKICDRYPYQVPVKGGYVPFTSENIYITSNAPIEEWYHFNGYNTAAILRRVEHLYLYSIPTSDEIFDVLFNETNNTQSLTDDELLSFIECLDTTQ